MTTQIDGSTGVSKVQGGVVVQADLAANVAGNGPAFSVSSSVIQAIASGTPSVSFQGFLARAA